MANTQYSIRSSLQLTTMPRINKDPRLNWCRMDSTCITCDSDEWCSEYGPKTLVICTSCQLLGTHVECYKKVRRLVRLRHQPIFFSVQETQASQSMQETLALRIRRLSQQDSAGAELKCSYQQSSCLQDTGKTLTKQFVDSGSDFFCSKVCLEHHLTP